MLTFDVNRKINTMRDILVGKIPDPKSQVEQITIAMIYKFMDDMDVEFLDWDGNRKFFANTNIENYEQYAWSNLMNPQNSGEKRSELYRDGIEKMNANPNLPQLFRDIFRNAYIPFRDSETLNMFLKEINDFKYENSEDLGNAFEMLLMIMGSQGDAGQFRTPRHIIDMIVDIVQPQKNDTILDPACGTAGFLISAYKHIMQANQDQDGNTTLTSEDKKRLTNNLCGYDISQDMVRLSRVNMYLHTFPDPKIYEYDTLTSQERWDDTFDVIFANPPFMTPKGGINPHKRFQFQAKRSEVLFVDYIAEHLNPNGKAGVIVPEGIVFQSAKAYKNLRQMLVENNYLYAVISLPAGVFNPYSGVKTSILLMDKSVAKNADSILFVKIDNDGFGLGAQRREISESDIPRTVELVNRYKDALLKGELLQLSEEEQSFAVVACREKIKEQEYILVGERYRESQVDRHTKWPMVELGEVSKRITKGTTPTTLGFAFQEKGINFIKIESITEHRQFNKRKFNYISEECNEALKRSQLENMDILFSIAGALGRVAVVSEDILPANTNQALAIISPIKEQINSKYISYMLSSENILNKIKSLKVGVAQNNLSLKQVSEFKIPLPSNSIQEQIVAEIEGYQKIIDGAMQVVENYRPSIKILPEWEMVELGTVCDITSSKRIFQEEYVNEGVPFYRTKEVSELSQGKEISVELFISNDRYTEIKNKFDIPKKGDILLSAVGTIGISWVIPDNRKFYFKDGNLLWIKQAEGILSFYLKYVLDACLQGKIKSLTYGAAYNALTIVEVKQLEIPLPPLCVQQEIVQQINEEQAIVAQNKRLIEIFEGKIKDKISEVWGG